MCFVVLVKIPTAGAMFTVAPFFDVSIVVIDMTRARAVSQFTDSVESFRTFRFLVRAALVVAGMATCAIRLIGGKRPGNGFIVGSVTVLAFDR